MYDTYIYSEHVITEPDLTRAFARAIHVAPESIAAIGSPEPVDAAEAWGDPEKATVLRYWTIPGEFPFAVEILFKQPDIANDQETLAILRRVAAEVKTPLLSTARDGFGTFLALFPDGAEFLVDEDSAIEDPALAITPASRRRFDEARVRSARAVLAAD